MHRHHFALVRAARASRAFLAASALGLPALLGACRTAEVGPATEVDGVPTTDDRELRAAAPVDVLVLPVQVEIEGDAPIDTIERRVRAILLSKGYSVLGRGLAHESAPRVLAAVPPASGEEGWRERFQRSEARLASLSAQQRQREEASELAEHWIPGAAGEDAFFRVVLRSFEVPRQGPVRKMEIEADFELVGGYGTSEGEVLWAHRGARAFVPHDRFGDEFRSREDAIENLVSWYVEAILKHLPPCEPIDRATIRRESRGGGPVG